MIWSSRSVRLASLGRPVTLAATLLFALFTGRTSTAAAQGDQSGSIAGTVVDDQGTPLGGAQVAVPGTTIGTQTRSNGEYVLPRVPAGSHSLQARLLGYRPESAPVEVGAGRRTIHNFTLRRDPLQLQTMVVTGTQSPRMNLDASVAITTLTATEIERLR